MPFPTVTIFMDGFKPRVAEYYAKENKQGRRGRRLGRQERLLHRWLRGQRGRDHHREAGPRPGRRRDPARRWPDLPGRDHRDRQDSAGKDVAMIGVDADLCETDPSTQDYVMTSILKDMKVSTYEAIMAAGNDDVRLRRPTSAPWRTTASASRRSTTSRTRSTPTLKPASSTTVKAGHHRRLDQGGQLPRLIADTLHLLHHRGRPTHSSASPFVAMSGRDQPHPLAHLGHEPRGSPEVTLLRALSRPSPVPGPRASPPGRPDP